MTGSQNIQEKLERLKFLEYLLDQLPGTVYLKSPDGQYIYCNQAMLDAFEASSMDQIINHSDQDIHSKPNAGIITDNDAKVSTMGELFIEQRSNKDGQMTRFISSKRLLKSHQLIRRYHDAVKKKHQSLEGGKAEQAIEAKSNVEKNNQSESEVQHYIIGHSMNYDGQAKQFSHIDCQLSDLVDQISISQSVIQSFAHDARIPLVGLLDQVQTISNRQQKGCQTQAEIESLKVMISDYFEYHESLLEDMKLEMDPSIASRQNHWVKLSELSGCIHKRFGSSAVAKGIDFTINDCIPVTTEGLTKKIWLERILVNLVSNAIKFTEVGEVKVSLMVSQSNCLIKVVDTGIGIAQHNHNKVFQHLFMVEKGSHKNPGLGIGLSSVKRLVNALSGHIKLNSELNQGTSIEVSLPMIFRQSEAGLLKKQKQNLIEDQTITHQYDIPGGVLIVEDVDLPAEILERNIKCISQGRVDRAKSVKEAINLVNSHNYGVVFLDLGLPDGSGYEVAHVIRKMSKQPFIIGNSAYTDSTLIKEATHHHGFDRLYAKPMVMSDLLSVAQTYFSEAPTVA